MLSRCLLDFSVGVGAFVLGLSQISSFFSYDGVMCYIFRISISWCSRETLSDVKYGFNVQRL